MRTHPDDLRTRLPRRGIEPHRGVRPATLLGAVILFLAAVPSPETRPLAGVAGLPGASNGDCAGCHAGPGDWDSREVALATHQNLDCTDCHSPHGDTPNLYNIRERIETPNSGTRSVVFLSERGVNSFADGDSVLDGVCEVCHTATDYHRNDPSGAHDHYPGSRCTTCHTHDLGFAPRSLTSHQGLSCTRCHGPHGEGPNLRNIRERIETPNSGTRDVLFLSYTGPHSFADGDAVYDGVCEVCHTTTEYHRNDESGDHSHNSGADCTRCHSHDDGFVPVNDVVGVGGRPTLAGGTLIQDLRAAPAPSRGAPRILAKLGHVGAPMRARGSVFEVTGRLVRSFPVDLGQGGDRTIVWDGRDHAGDPVTPGTYLFRLDWGRESRSCKLVIVR